MKVNRYLTALLSMAILILISGCSGRSTPVLPQDIPEPIDSLPVIGLTEADNMFNAIGMLGAYELTLDIESSSAELIPKRSTSIGESYIVSGIGFFTISPCVDCLKLKAIDFSSYEYFELIFSIKHPFDKGDVLKPPSAANRLDLDVFDLALIVSPSDFTPTTYSLTGMDIYTNICVNPAGYTSELTEVIDDPAAVPYFLAIDDTDTGISTWNKFEMGSESEISTAFNLFSGFIRFDLYLTMAYGASAKKSERLDPKYYNPEFNRKAAWKVVVTPPEGDDPPATGNTWRDSDSTTEYSVKVEVCDWQQDALVYTDPADFANAPEDNVYSSSNVASVSIEIPGMNNSLQSTANDDGTGTGMPDSPLVFNVPIANQNLLTAGEYIGLVKVSDERLPLAVTDNRDHLIDSPNGFELINYEIPEYATYQTFIATVVTGNLLPVADAEATTSTDIMEGMGVTFDATASNDPDGTIDTYEWDFDEDGVFSESPDDDYTGDSWNPTHYFAYGDGSIDVQLMVTDNLSGTDELDTPITITVCQTKNIDITNTGGKARDLCIDPSSGDVLVLYDMPEVGGRYRAEVRRYNFSDCYTSYSTITDAVKHHWYDCDAGVFIDFAQNGYWFICSQYGTSCPNMELGYDHFNGTTDAFILHWGIGIGDNPPHGSVKLADAACMYNTGYAYDHVGIFGRIDGQYYPPYDDRYATQARGRSDSGFTTGWASSNWWYPSACSGYNALDYHNIMGAEASPLGTYLWYVEDEDHYAARFNVISGSFSMTYASRYFGTGVETDNADGVCDPLDITCGESNHFFILDQLSDESFVIKGFISDGSSGDGTTPLTSFSQGPAWAQDPIRIDGSLDQNLLAVLMTDGTNSAMSIFTAGETPDS